MNPSQVCKVVWKFVHQTRILFLQKCCGFKKSSQRTVHILQLIFWLHHDHKDFEETVLLIFKWSEWLQIMCNSTVSLCHQALPSICCSSSLVLLQNLPTGVLSSLGPGLASPAPLLHTQMKCPPRTTQIVILTWPVSAMIGQRRVTHNFTEKASHLEHLNFLWSWIVTFLAQATGPWLFLTFHRDQVGANCHPQSLFILIQAGSVPDKVPDSHSLVVIQIFQRLQRLHQNHQDLKSWIILAFYAAMFKLLSAPSTVQESLRQKNDCAVAILYGILNIFGNHFTRCKFTAVQQFELMFQVRFQCVCNKIITVIKLITDKSIKFLVSSGKWRLHTFPNAQNCRKDCWGK